jgi:hypothetical protein
MSNTKKTPVSAFLLHASEENHLDNWLDDPDCPSPENKPILYAKFVLEYMRMPAWKISAFEQFMSKHKLFCTYEGKRYRVVMASRLGTIGLNPDLSADCGAIVHAYPKKCEDWSDKP